MAPTTRMVPHRNMVPHRIVVPHHMNLETKDGHAHGRPVSPPAPPEPPFPLEKRDMPSVSPNSSNSSASASASASALAPAPSASALSDSDAVSAATGKAGPGPVTGPFLGAIMDPKYLKSRIWTELQSHAWDFSENDQPGGEEDHWPVTVDEVVLPPPGSASASASASVPASSAASSAASARCSASSSAAAAATAAPPSPFIELPHWGGCYEPIMDQSQPADIAAEGGDEEGLDGPEYEDASPDSIEGSWLTFRFGPEVDDEWDADVVQERSVPEEEDAPRRPRAEGLKRFKRDLGAVEASEAPEDVRGPGPVVGPRSKPAFDLAPAPGPVVATAHAPDAERMLQLLRFHRDGENHHDHHDHRRDHADNKDDDNDNDRATARRPMSPLTLPPPMLPLPTAGKLSLETRVSHHHHRYHRHHHDDDDFDISTAEILCSPRQSGTNGVGCVTERDVVSIAMWTVGGFALAVLALIIAALAMMMVHRRSRF